jgi:hypothetical protein
MKLKIELVAFFLMLSVAATATTLQLKSGVGVVGSQDASTTVRGFYTGLFGQGNYYFAADWATSNPYIVTTFPGAWYDIAGSDAKWIAPDIWDTGDGRFFGLGPEGEYEYVINFGIHEVPTTAFLDMSFSADDSGTK